MATKAKSDVSAYCTFFDSGYLSRGLAMIESVRRFDTSSPIYVLALDDIVADYLGARKDLDVTVLRIDQLEKFAPELLTIKSTRSRMEYYFTCTPQLFKYIFSLLKTPGASISYLDADLYFYSDPRQIREALGDFSVGITEHRLFNPPKIQQAYGRFNAGFLTFRDTVDGNRVLDWWAERALEWCYDKPSEGRYANQGYLNWFPDFEGVLIYPSAGMNTAPWNTRRHRFTLSPQGDVRVDGDPLVFFHFHGVRKKGERFVTSELIYGSRLNKITRDHVYTPYVSALSHQDGVVERAITAPAKMNHRGNGISGLIGRARKNVVDVLTVVTGNSLPAPRRR
ncbi:MAG: hypothetical protein NTY82_02730 [Actinobacteria bacterium]|nr:hypothetical protein [Actinomycetota bacterium]